MPTTVGILTFISRINTIFESLKARKNMFSAFQPFYKQLKFHAYKYICMLSMKNVENIEARIEHTHRSLIKAWYQANRKNTAKDKALSIGKSRPNSRIKPRMYVRRSIMYEKTAFY